MNFITFPGDIRLAISLLSTGRHGVNCIFPETQHVFKVMIQLIALCDSQSKNRASAALEAIIMHHALGTFHILT